ncbi:hypothetical protein IQ272_32950 [Chroococcidiopsidales cyanobacterium LEGE 13417]|nr:hypothetical protein [Chroococcidiopsidales cyanobacterium LEGE 13417]
MRTEPVKFSAGPLVEGCEPFRLTSTVCALLLDGACACSTGEKPEASREDDTIVIASSFISISFDVATEFDRLSR